MTNMTFRIAVARGLQAKSQKLIFKITTKIQK